jgi:uncharacterized membrane protein YgcG
VKAPVILLEMALEMILIIQIMKNNMPMKILNKTNILTLSLLGLAILMTPFSSVFAVTPPLTPPADLVVQLEGGGPALFSEANFMPGQSVTRWVDVINNTSETKAVGVKASDFTNCSENCLSDRLNLEITKEGSVVYGPVSLTEFFTAGEKKLSDLGSGDTQRYYFKITFLPDSENQYQGKEVSFDFDIGFFGQETIGGGEETGGGSSGGGGGGGSFGGSTGLIIFDEGASPVVSNQTEITWKTNNPATSRVIYSSQYEPHTFDLNNPPNYGYVNSTLEESTKKTEHSMNISGLIPGVTYYYRVVSRGSFAVSVEHQFTVPGVMPAETFSGDDGYRDFQNQNQIVAIGENGQRDGENEGGEEETNIEEDNEKIEKDGKSQKNSSNPFLASFLDLSKFNFCTLFFIFLIIIIALLLLSLENNKKEEDIKKRWITTIVAIIALIILYSFICPYYLNLIIVTAVLMCLFLLWYFRDYKNLNKQ